MLSNSRGQWAYHWRHPSTGREGVRLTATPMTRADFLAVLLRWTNQQPGRWAYGPDIPPHFTDAAQALITASEAQPHWLTSGAYRIQGS